jgi:flagellar motor switch protein FliN/FliY
MSVAVEIGRGTLKIREILAMRFQSIIALNKAAGKNMDVRVNGVLVGRGEPVVTEDRIGIKINEVIGSEN